MDETPTFLFAGGGTGGHLFPGIAVAEALQRRLPGVRCVFVGSGRDVETQIVNAAGFAHVALPSPPSTLIRRKPLRFLVDYHRARRAAAALLRDLWPNAVIGLGGFASAPVVRAARRCRVPVVLLEQNAVAGRATQWLSRGAAAVCHTFAEAVPSGRKTRNAIVTGNPVRHAIADLATKHHTPHDQPMLLILGGSQGSTAVNEAVLQAASALRNELADWRIQHQTGPQDVERVAAAYSQLGIGHTVAAFFEDLPARYATADMAVARAGATTLAELACAAVPAVLIPYPNAVKNHQLRNAEVFAKADAATIVPQHRDPGETARQLTAALRSLISDGDLRNRQSAAMRSLAHPDAADRVADCVLRIAGLQHCEARPGPPHFAESNCEVSRSPRTL